MNRTVAITVALTLLLGANASAQVDARGGSAGGELRGRVTAGSAPVPNQVVTLHRVSDIGTGGSVDEDTTAADGTFTLTMGAVDTSSVYFVATVYENELYIGDTFQSSYSGEYALPVGPGAVPIRIEGQGTQPSPEQLQTPEDRIAGAVVIMAGILIVGGIAWLFMRPRPSPIRPMLLEIARLDEEYEKHPTEANRARRAELVRKIREAA